MVITWSCCWQWWGCWVSNLLTLCCWDSISNYTLRWSSSGYLADIIMIVSWGVALFLMFNLISMFTVCGWVFALLECNFVSCLSRVTGVHMHELRIWREVGKSGLHGVKMKELWPRNIEMSETSNVPLPAQLLHVTDLWSGIITRM